MKISHRRTTPRRRKTAAKLDRFGSGHRAKGVLLLPVSPQAVRSVGLHAPFRSARLLQPLYSPRLACLLQPAHLLPVAHSLRPSCLALAACLFRPCPCFSLRTPLRSSCPLPAARSFRPRLRSFALLPLCASIPSSGRGFAKTLQEPSADPAGICQRSSTR